MQNKYVCMHVNDRLLKYLQSKVSFIHKITRSNQLGFSLKRLHSLHPVTVEVKTKVRVQTKIKVTTSTIPNYLSHLMDHVLVVVEQVVDLLRSGVQLGHLLSIGQY